MTSSLAHLDCNFSGRGLAEQQAQSLQAGAIDAETLLGTVIVEDTRPPATRLRQALEDLGNFVVDVETEADAIDLELAVDQPTASEDALIGQWLEVFDRLVAEDESFERWTVRFVLPDYSRPIVTVTRDDYLAYQAGELSRPPPSDTWRSSAMLSGNDSWRANARHNQTARR